MTVRFSAKFEVRIPEQIQPQVLFVENICEDRHAGYRASIVAAIVPLTSRFIIIKSRVSSANPCFVIGEYNEACQRAWTRRVQNQIHPWCDSKHRKNCDKAKIETVMERNLMIKLQDKLNKEHSTRASRCIKNVDKRVGWKGMSQHKVGRGGGSGLRWCSSWSGDFQDMS